MPLPLPPPDIAELAEYLATHLLLEMGRGEYSGEDMRSSPEIGCLEQVAAELHRNRRELPTSIREVLAKAEEAGRVMHARNSEAPARIRSAGGRARQRCPV